MTKPLSFSRISPLKSSEPASWTKGIDLSIEPEPSTTRPIVSGSFSAISKPVIFCGRPSSWIEKSLSARPLHEVVALVERGDVELDDVDAHVLDRRVGPLEHPDVVGLLAVLARPRSRAGSSPFEYSVNGIVTS